MITPCQVFLPLLEEIIVVDEGLLVKATNNRDRAQHSSRLLKNHS